jgi:NADH-quinone oxidoreductase subunit E
MSTTEKEIKFSDKTMARVNELITHYPEGKQKSALLPILHLAQKEFGGWLSVPAMDYVASILKLEKIEVYEVATFYTMYNQRPVGKCMIEFCQTGPCLLKDTEPLIAYTEKKLGIKVGETTPDSKFTLKAVECLGACGYAPMAQIGQYYYQNLTEAKIDKIIAEFGKPDFDPEKKYEI